METKQLQLSKHLRGERSFSSEFIFSSAPTGWSPPSWWQKAIAGGVMFAHHFFSPRVSLSFYPRASRFLNIFYHKHKTLKILEVYHPADDLWRTTLLFSTCKSTFFKSLGRGVIEKQQSSSWTKCSITLFILTPLSSSPFLLHFFAILSFFFSSSVHFSSVVDLRWSQLCRLFWARGSPSKHRHRRRLSTFQKRNRSPGWQFFTSTCCAGCGQVERVPIARVGEVETNHVGHWHPDNSGAYPAARRRQLRG